MSKGNPVDHRNVEERLTSTPVPQRRGAERVGSHCRCGFTLLEMMLVLGLIGVFAAMTMPSIMRIFGQQTLTDSADRVRAALSSARVRAIESGLIYQFCCESNGGHFVVLPFEPDHVNSNHGGNSGTTTRVSRSWGKLPKGITFSSVVTGLAGGATAAANSHKLASAALDGLPNSSDLASLNWASPILFNSNGSASMDAEIVIGDHRAQHVRLKVRAFTGAVSLGRVSSEKRQ